MDTVASVTRQLLKERSVATSRRQEVAEPTSSFHVMCTGQIQSGQIDGIDNLYCRYTISCGNDWTIVHGVDAGLSQIARKSSGEDSSVVVWNFPIDLTFKSTNAFGWPRIAISVYGIDSLGRDVVQGYGSVLLPTTSGCHERVVCIYRPIASSLLQQFLGWVSGTLPEFFDSKFVSQAEGREVTRVQSTGLLKLKLNVLTKGLSRFGYQSGDYPIGEASSAPPARHSSGGKGSSSAPAGGFEGSAASQLLLDRTAAAFLPPKTPIPLRGAMPKT